MALSTPTLPVRLSPGLVSIYGSRSIYGITSNKMVQFGVINQLSPTTSGTYSLGDSVMFLLEDSMTVTWGRPYFLIEEEKIILTEDEIPPAP